MFWTYHEEQYTELFYKSKKGEVMTWNKTLQRMENATGLNHEDYNIGFIAMNFWNRFDQLELDEFRSQMKQIKPKPSLVQVNDYQFKLA